MAHANKQSETHYPHITVACTIEKDSRYLMVRERTDQGERINQPAGHLEVGETLVQAAVREALEETAWKIEVTSLLGISHYIAQNNVHYVRVSFTAKAIACKNSPLDDDIIEAVWLNKTELDTRVNELRSPLVLEDIERFERGERHSLALLHGFP